MCPLQSTLKVARSTEGGSNSFRPVPSNLFMCSHDCTGGGGEQTAPDAKATHSGETLYTQVVCTLSFSMQKETRQMTGTPKVYVSTPVGSVQTAKVRARR